MRKYLIVILLIFLPVFSCKTYEVLPEKELIVQIEFDEDLFITVYTNYRVLEFEPPVYKGLNALLDTMPYDSTGEYEIVEDEQ